MKKKNIILISIFSLLFIIGIIVSIFFITKKDYLMVKELMEKYEQDLKKYL